MANGKKNAAMMILISDRVKLHLKSIKHNKGHILMLGPTITKKHNIHGYRRAQTHNDPLYEVETTGDTKQ